MGVMMQTFHWDCPREDKKEFQWWNYINEQVPALAKVGFTSLWLPPIHNVFYIIKGAHLGEKLLSKRSPPHSVFSVR